MELDTRLAAQLADRAGPHPTDQQFRLLVDSVTDYAIFLLDPVGCVMSWNQGAARIEGYSAAEILGRHFSVFYPPEAREAGTPEQLLFRAEREGRAENEGWRVRADGSRFWADTVITALRTPAGALSGFAKVTRDMTARQRLRENETMLATMFERSPLGIVLMDPSGRCVRGNPSFLRMFGYGEEELARKSFAELAHPQDLEESWRTLEDLIQGRRNQADYEKRYLRRNGQVIWVRAAAARLPDPDGRLRYLMVMVEDITERQRAYEALVESEQALRALSRRLVQVEENERRRIARELHDRVGQNLSALNINLDILLGRLADPVLRKRLEDSLSLVDGTLQSIENVMADLRPPLLDEYGLAAALAWYGEEYAGRTGVRVAVDGKDAGRALRPEAAVALFRIAQEALNNVAKHAGATVVRIAMRADHGDLTLSISDDGCGFDMSQAPRGRWGMSTMRERAEAAGGRLAVESSPGKGTTVRATVPL